MGRVRIPRAAPRLVALLALVGGACAAPPIARPKTGDAAPSAESLAPLFITPARWDYHPPGPDGALAATEIPGGGCVFTAEGGQRWTSAAGGLAR